MVLYGHLWHKHKHNHKQKCWKCFLSHFIEINSEKNFSFETFFHSDPTHHTIFFHVSCGCPKATFGHYWGESLANLVLITAFDTYSTWKSSGASKQGGCKGQAPTGVWTRTPLVLNVTPLPTRPLAWKLQK